MALTRAMRAQNEVETLGKVIYNYGNQNSDRSFFENSDGQG